MLRIPKVTQIIHFFFPILIGICAFVLVVSPGFLNPQNIAWIHGADPEQQFIGWEFFRHSPWSFPIGLNPKYGLEISSSIVYSDSIPLLAIFFKAFNYFLPDTFQYFGIWVLCCFIFQAWFAWKIMKLMTNDTFSIFLATVLLIFTPPMLVRIGFHNNVVGHFQILAAFYLILRPIQSHRKFLWIILIMTALAVNFYIFVIIFGLWIVDLCIKIFTENLITKRQAFVELGIGILFIFITGWQLGYFTAVNAISAGVYGTSHMNVLAPIDASGWSFILNSYTNSLNSYEGFSFLGFGIILGFLFLVPSFMARKLILRKYLSLYRYLIIFLIVCTAFAITNHVSIGSWSFEFPLPNFILHLGSILRESTRLFWPSFYAIVLGLIFLIMQCFSKSVVRILLGLICATQIIDTSAGWLPIKEKMQSESTKPDVFSQYLNTLTDPFWKMAPIQYKNVLMIPTQEPPGKIPYDWEKLATYAAKYRLGTNSVYLARVDLNKLSLFNNKFNEQLKRGKFESDSYYVIGDELILPVLMHLNSNQDLFARINGYNVLAPNWKTCPTCLQIPAELEIKAAIPEVQLNTPFYFSSSGEGKHFLVGIAKWPQIGWGWSYPENFGTWSEGYQTKVTIPLPKTKANSLTLTMQALISPSHPKQTVGLWVNGRFQEIINLSKANENVIRIPLSKTDTLQEYITIRLDLPDHISPKSINQGADERKLAIGLVSGIFE